ncbi:hypothetical protein GGX14DRAFT_633797 [Mycena pura]|uniref:F-box domain-containing protein n=1 Tax=Mycena pura TaxID=153505 RepID=A0AAD6Y951_9AGAR|nr:hypothetical protein GGX14DRAFT_633797 [Mycena pura]
MKLLDLPLELLLIVLCFCDVSSVVSASQTNKMVHDLASSRIVWISLVSDLQPRGFVDRLSAADVRVMPTSDLVALVRRLVVGPAAWSPTQSSAEHPSHSASHVVLRPAITPGHRFSQHDVAVLPPGEHVLLNNTRGLECWRVSDGVRVWRYKSESERVTAFAADVQDGGKSANLVICISGAPPHRGIVFDWRSKTYCKVGESASHWIALDFIPGHFIATSHERIEVYLMVALAGRWVPAEGTVHLDETETVVLGRRMSPVVADSVRPKAMRSPMVAVTVQPNPLVHGTFRVWIFLYPTRPHLQVPLDGHDADDEATHLFCFRLGLGPDRAFAALAGASEGRPLQLRRLKTLRPPREASRCITYAGHTLALPEATAGRDSQWVISRATPTPAGSWESVGLVKLKRRPHVAPVVTTYGGAVAYVARRSLIVQYFE